MTDSDHSDASQRTSSAIVFITHFVNDSIEQEMNLIAKAAHGTQDLWSTAYLPQGKVELPHVPSPWTFVPVLQADIMALGYDAKLKRVKHWRRLVFNLDLLLLSFYQKHPNYDRYWFIEFDVRFSGDWSAFFEELDRSSADMLCTNVERRREDNSPWMHWDDFTTPVPQSDHVKGFVPISRVSRRLLSAVDKAYHENWSGHCEAVWPTLAISQGMLVEDIGGTGSFVPDSRRGRFYLQAQDTPGSKLGTFSVWPWFSASLDYHKHMSKAYPNILWHPVK